MRSRMCTVVFAVAAGFLLTGGLPSAIAVEPLDLVPHSVSSGGTAAIPCQLGGTGGESWIILRMPDGYVGSAFWLEDIDVTPYPLVQVYGLNSPSDAGDRLSGPLGDMLPSAFQGPGGPPWPTYRYLRVEALSGTSSLTVVEAFQYVAAPNSDPVAVDDSAKTDPGVPVEINVLANDSDPDGDDLSVESFTQGTNGSVAANGDLLIYTPIATFVGTDTFSYTVADGSGGTATATVTVTVRLLIDIKPGSYPNSINLGSNGVVPVAILSTADFDATAIPADTVLLAGAGVAVRGKGNNTLASSEDVNGDGLPDLVLKVETENLDPGTFQDGQAILQVVEDPGAEPLVVLYEGRDDITIVPPE